MVGNVAVDKVTTLIVLLNDLIGLLYQISGILNCIFYSKSFALFKIFYIMRLYEMFRLIRTWLQLKVGASVHPSGFFHKKVQHWAFFIFSFLSDAQQKEAVYLHLIPFIQTGQQVSFFIEPLSFATGAITMANRKPKITKRFQTILLEKVRSSAKAGKDLIEKGLVLYYTWDDDDTPMWAKGTIVAALVIFSPSTQYWMCYP